MLLEELRDQLVKKFSSMNPQGLLPNYINPVMPNDHCTTPLTSKRCILYIYSTNTGTEYFKHGIYSLFFLFKMQFVS